jgi:hypothetical protein
MVMLLRGSATSNWLDFVMAVLSLGRIADSSGFSSSIELVFGHPNVSPTQSSRSNPRPSNSLAQSVNLHRLLKIDLGFQALFCLNLLSANVLVVNKRVSTVQAAVSARVFRNQNRRKSSVVLK